MKLRGLTVRCFHVHVPSQIALVLDSLSFRPDIIPNSFSMSKAYWTDIRLLQMRKVSSANELANFDFLMKDKNATNRINDLPVIGYPCSRKELWDRQGGKHCKSLEGNIRRRVVLTSKKRLWREFNAFSPSFYRKRISAVFDIWKT